MTLGSNGLFPCGIMSLCLGICFQNIKVNGPSPTGCHHHREEAANLVEPLLFQVCGNGSGAEKSPLKGRVVGEVTSKPTKIAVGEILPFGQIKYMYREIYIDIFVIYRVSHIYSHIVLWAGLVYAVHSVSSHPSSFCFV